MIWNQKFETMEQGALRKKQSESLCKLVESVYKNVPFYKQKMDKFGVKPSDISSVSDISKLPLTTKFDMREVYPFGLLNADKSEIVEIHTSSGTTGKPVVDAYTQNDIDVWSEVMARTLAVGDTTKDDIVQNAYGYGLFTGGLGVHYGARAIGAMIIPISGGNTKRQLSMLQDFGSTILTCTPSYSLMLAEVAKDEGLDSKSLPVRAGFFGAEPWSEGMRKEIEANLNLKAIDLYGLTEIIGPGVSFECRERVGMHICEDHFYPEIINPETGEVIADGEKGELVITTLTKTGTPVLRYRTRDITYLKREKCKCGRTSVRMNKILGRTDDMLIVRGVNVFPSQIEEALLKIDNVEPHYQIIVDRKGTLDGIEVDVEMSNELYALKGKDLSAKEKKIEEAVYTYLDIHSKVKLVEPKTIPRSMGKSKRVIDKRQI